MTLVNENTNAGPIVAAGDSHAVLCDEIAQLIVRVANLKHFKPEEIDRNLNLYRDGLGLDSIDLLEVVVNVERNYGLKLRNDESGQKALSNISNLATAISQHRASVAGS